MYEMAYMNKGYDFKKYGQKTNASFENEREFWPSLTFKERESSKYNQEPEKEMI